MKTNRIISLNLYFITALLTINNLFSQENKLNLTIEGIVEAFDNDAIGNVTQVAITTVEEVEHKVEYSTYIVVNDNKGKELLNLVGKNVEVTGTVEMNEDGDNYLTVSQYKVIHHDEEDEFEIPEEPEEF